MENSLRMLLVAAVFGVGLVLKMAAAQDIDSRPQPARDAPTDADSVPRPAGVALPDVPQATPFLGGTVPVPDTRFGGVQRMVPRIHTVVEYVREQVPQEELDEQKMISKAVQLLTSSADDAAKTKATAALQQLLERAFSRDVGQREKQIADVEARVKKLRDQIEKRKKAKEQIIELRLKTIVNDAEGLGFPTPFGAPQLAQPPVGSPPTFVPAGIAPPKSPSYSTPTNDDSFVPRRGDEGEPSDSPKRAKPTLFPRRAPLPAKPKGEPDSQT